VKWSGIQSDLEYATSDVLIILDCCKSGKGTGESSHCSSVTELIAACNYETMANGVGVFSFTHHLNLDLRARALTRQPFTAAELYDDIYNRMQSHMMKGFKDERYPAPVHLFLTRDQHSRNRSIELTPLKHESLSAGALDSTCSTQSQPTIVTLPGSPPPLHPHSNPSEAAGKDIKDPAVLESAEGHDSTTAQQEVRKVLFAVRLEETMPTEDLVVEAFVEWLRSIPALVRDVAVTCKIEAQFLCDSTLVLFTVPISVWVCMEHHPAVMCLGPVKSSNLLSSPKVLEIKKGTTASGKFTPFKCLIRGAAHADEFGVESRPDFTDSAHELSGPLVSKRLPRNTESFEVLKCILDARTIIESSQF